MIACGGDKPPPTSPQPITGSLLDCATVADHVANTAVAAKPLPGATYASIKELVATRCQADAWTDETKQCFHAIAKILDGRACAKQLTEEQRKALHAQALALSKGATPGSDPDDHNSDWIRHVVEEPGTRTR